MEIQGIITRDAIPGSIIITSTEKKAFLKSVATLRQNEVLKIKIKNESEACKLNRWLREGFSVNKYKLTRRRINKQLFAFVFPEEV